MYRTSQPLEMYNTWGLEAMEPRLLLAAPELNFSPFVFGNVEGEGPPQYIFNSTGSVTVPISAFDSDGHALEISARFLDNDNFDVQVVANSTFAKLNFALPQIWLGTVSASPALGQTFTLSVTMDSTTRSVDYTVVTATTSATTVATMLANAWNAANYTFASPVTAYASSGSIYLTSEQSFTTSTSGTWGVPKIVQEAQTGTILVELFTGRATSKAAAERFITLATNQVNSNGTLNPGGKPFYTDVNVHRIVENFMLQCGDAQNGNGTGKSPLPNLGDSYDTLLSFASRGLMAMAASSNPNSANCQWFIMDGPATHLDNSYTIFGQMIDGWAFLEKIMTTPVVANSSGEVSKPIGTPILKNVEVLTSADAEANQSFTLIITPKNGYVGTGTLEITLSDGEGNVEVYTLDVTACGIEKINTVQLPPGGTITLPVGTVLDANRTATIEVDKIDIGSASATYDKVSGLLTIKTPGSYIGTFTVTVRMTIEPGTSGRGDKTYVTQTFYVVCTIPEGPEYVFAQASPFGKSAENTCVSGNLLFVAHGQTGVKIYDISNPREPVFVTLLNTPGHAWDMKVVGNILFVTDWGVQTDSYLDPGTMTTQTTTYGMLEAWDISDLDNIAMVGSIKMQFIGTLPCGFVIRDGIAYVAEYNNGLTTYDVSDPAGIKRLNTISSYTFPWDPRNPISMKGMVDVAVNGNYAYVSDLQYSVIFVIGVSNPKKLTYVNYTYVPNGSPWGLVVDNNILYVADQGLGLLTFDISRKGGLPIRLGTQMLPVASTLRVADVTVDGVTKKYAVVATMDGTAFVDVTNPKKPQMSFMSSSNGRGLTPAVSGSIAYTLSESGMVAIDMAGLGRITLVKNATFVTEAGVTVTVRLTGDGGIVKPDSGFDGEQLKIFGGSGNTSVTITTRGGVWEADSVVVYGTLRSLTATTTQAGEFSFSGIGALKLGDLPNGSRIHLGWGFEPTHVTLGHVADVSLITLGDISRLTVKSWRDTDRDPDDEEKRDLLYARSCQVITCRGEFAPDVALTGNNNYVMQVLRTARIDGDVYNARWDLNGVVGDITVKGVISGWDAWMMTLNKGKFGVVTSATVVKSVEGEEDTTETVKSRLEVKYWATSIAAASWTGDIQAQSLGSLTLKGAMAGRLTAMTMVDTWYGAQQPQYGDIGRISVASWESGELTARSVGNLRVTGDIGINLAINGPANSVNLSNVRVGNIVGGVWYVAGGTGTVRAGGISGEWVATFDDVRTLTVAKGDMVGATITADSIGTMNVTGDLRDSSVQAMNTPSGANAKVKTVGKFTVGGVMENSSLVSLGHIGSVTLGALLQGRVTAGVILGTDHASTVHDFTKTGGRIDSVTIKGVRGLDVAFDGWISAPALGRVSLVNANVDLLSEFPELFGVSAMTMDRYTYKGTTGKVSWTARSGRPWPTGIANFTLLQIKP